MIDYGIFTNEEEIPGEGIVLKRARAKVQSPGGVLSNTVKSEGGTMLPNALRSRALSLRGKVSELEGQEPDISGAINYAKQQGEQGNMAMMNALAAQYAGEGFAPLQQAFNKRAEASRSPLKFGSVMVTPEGEVIRDTFADRDRRIASLERQADAAERLAATTDEAQARRLETERRNREQERMAQEGLEIRRSLAENVRANRANADDGKNFTRATTLRNEYGKKADKISEGTRHAETVMTLLTDPTIAQDPTKQVSLVFAFGKMLDPESVVRESEYALIANARGMFEGLLQKPDQIMTGARLTPQQLQSMQQIARQLYSGSTQRRQDLANYYQDIAKRNRLNVEDVLPPGTTGQPQGGSFADPEKERRYQEWKRQQSGGKP